MSSKIRNCVKELRKERNLEKMLPEYVEQSMQIYNNFAQIQFMMEYFTFYETVLEGTNPYMKSAAETTEALHRIVEVYYEGNPSAEQLKEMGEKLLDMRQEVLDKVQVLTAYADCFVVYEYIFNRMQYRFEDMEMMPDDDAFAQSLVEAVFSGEDNVAISDSIRAVLGQLPVRMARGRYFDWVRNSISIYIGSDKGALESFLYMFRMSALLYRDEHMKEYFGEFMAVIEEMAALDYDGLNEDAYRIYVEKIVANASKLNDLSDFYIQLGQLINIMYTSCVSASFVGKKEKTDAERVVIRGINALFLSKDSDVWNFSEEPVETDDEKVDWLEGQFARVEGKMESSYAGISVCGGSIDEIMESQEKMITSLGLLEDFKVLERLSLFSSDSIFADLAVDGQEEIVSEQSAEEAADELIAECKAFFKGKSRAFRRAVMANTMKIMPIPFHSPEEFLDYVTESLQQCDDASEKYVAKQLLLEEI